MASIIFKIGGFGNKDLDPNKPQTIYLRYKYSSDVDFRASTKIKIPPKYWNAKKQKPKNNSEYQLRHDVDEQLNELVDYLNKYESKLLRKKQKPTNATIKKHFKEYFKEDKTEIKKHYNLFEYIEYFINRPDVMKSVSSGTIKNYKGTQRCLKQFSDEVYPLDFDNIDLDFYAEFLDWCENQNYSLNYIGKHIKTLKTFLNNATTDKVNTNLAFLSKRFKILKEDAENVYLSMHELKKIYDLDLSNLPKHDNARDLFLIGAYTGLRVSDFNHLKENNFIKIGDEDFLKVETKKTGKLVYIPLRPEVKSIFKKYGDQAPPRMPDQHINKKIKDVCENAGIDSIEYMTTTIGGKKVTFKKFKFDLVKNHTGRRSFCTNAYLSGMQPIDIMQISGHTSEKTFLNYIKATSEQRALKISQNSFFKDQLLKSV